MQASGSWAQEWVYHARPESSADARLDYPIALLKLCLVKSATQFQLKQSELAMQQGRSLRLLEQGQGIDVVWTLTSAEREQKLLPIRIPIDRGLIGWRLLLIRSNDSERFASVRTAADLAHLRAGLGHDWPDTQVLRANNYNVQTSGTYDGLFKMLARGHIDYFPRAVTEIQPELTAHQAVMPIAIESTLLLQYPAALYFFVNRDNQRLAAAIELGLQRAMDDGSMQALFEEYFGAVIKRANLTQRRLIVLENPDLPAATPLADKSLWFALDEFE